MTTTSHDRYHHDGIVIVGSGAVNLVTALELLPLGRPLLVVEAGPDPRLPWLPSTSCTMRGADARIVSLNESRHHFLKATPDPRRAQFDRTIADGGWLGVPPGELRERDHEWIARFRDIPPEAYPALNDQLVDCNRRGLERWQALIAQRPALFHGITVEQLVRIYLTPESHAAGLTGERAIGAFVGELSPAEVDAQLASTAAYREGGYLAAVRVRGLGVNVHGFVRRAVSLLEAHGARFLWNTEIVEIARTPQDELAGLVTRDGLRMVGDHVIVSPGVPRPGTLEGLPGRELIAGVAGGWLTLPNDVAALDVPVKLARRGFAADESSAGANLIPGRAADGSPVLHISSGHAYVGADRASLDPTWLTDLARVLHETARELFPRQYAAAVDRGLVVPGQLGKVCVRPWTPSCLGIFDDTLDGPGGRLLVTGGHNTGGFAQAPVVADAVREWLAGNGTTIRDTYFAPAAITAAR